MTQRRSVLFCRMVWHGRPVLCVRTAPGWCLLATPRPNAIGSCSSLQGANQKVPSLVRFKLQLDCDEKKRWPLSFPSTFSFALPLHLRINHAKQGLGFFFLKILRGFILKHEETTTTWTETHNLYRTDAIKFIYLFIFKKWFYFGSVDHPGEHGIPCTVFSSAGVWEASDGADHWEQHHHLQPFIFIIFIIIIYSASRSAWGERGRWGGGGGRADGAPGGHGAVEAVSPDRHRNGHHQVGEVNQQTNKYTNMTHFR